MTAAEQAASGCRIGAGGDYPAPILDHAKERAAALAMLEAVRK
jgi:deoxyribodipyrimidine photolyase